MSHSKAYTLLELVLVLAILATILAAAAPRLGGFAEGRKAEDTAARFVALTHWARSQAISNGTPYQLTLDPAAGAWWLEVDQDGSFGPAEGGFGKTYTAPDGVTLTCELPVVDGKQVITFDPTGRTDTGRVRFTGTRGQTDIACESPLEEFRVLKNAEAGQ